METTLVKPLVCDRDRKGFTLIELLVVIAIISLLISLLVPSLGRAMESANRVACASNVRNMHLATVAYAMDHNGQLPGPSWVTVGWRFVDRTLSPGQFEMLTRRLAVKGYVESMLEGTDRVVPSAICPSAMRAGFTAAHFSSTTLFGRSVWMDLPPSNMAMLDSRDELILNWIRADLGSGWVWHRRSECFTVLYGDGRVEQDS